MVRPSTPSDTTIRDIQYMQAGRMGCAGPSDFRSEGIARIGLVLSWLEVSVAKGMQMKPESECVRQDVHCGQFVGHSYALPMQGQFLGLPWRKLSTLSTG